MKNLLIVGLILFSVNAHAGFITGVVGGVVGASLVAGDKAPPQPQIIQSDHESISCRTRDGYQCVDTNNNYRLISPAQYTTVAGYKVLYKIGLIFNGDDQIHHHGSKQIKEKL